MSKTVGNVDWYVDTTKAMHTIGVMQGVAKELGKEEGLEKVIESAHTIYSREFDRTLNALAKLQKDNFHHVYEYNLSGNPYGAVGLQRAKLWRHTFKGRVNKKDAGFRFVAAKVRNPTYEQRRASRVGFDGIRDLPMEEYTKLLRRSRRRKHVFRWKSVLLEYGAKRNVEAKSGERLFSPQRGQFINSPKSRSERENSDGQFRYNIFPKKVVAATQQPGNVKGNFNAFWLKWWGSRNSRLLDEKMNNQLVKDIQTQTLLATSGFGGGTRFSKATSAISGSNNAYRRGILQGEQVAAMSLEAAHKRTESAWAEEIV